MTGRKLLILIVLAIACLLGTTYTALLLQSPDKAILVYIVGSASILLLLEPFFGLVYYILVLYLQPQEFMPAMAKLPIVLMTGSAAMGSMIMRLSANRTLSFFRTPSDGFVWWVAIAVVVSNLAHLDTAYAMETGISFAPMLVLYFLVSNLVTTEKRFRIMIQVLIGVTMIIAVIAILMSFIGTDILGQTSMQGRIRGIGKAKNPNMLAITVLVMIPFLYIKMVESRALFGKLVAITCMVVLAYALYLTNSRGGVLSFGGVAALLFLKRFGLVRGTILGVLVFVGITLFGPSRMGEISASEASAHNRLVSWEQGINFLVSYPVFGIGAYQWAHKYYTVSMVAHNSFLHVAAELGFFGLFPWVLMIFMSLKNAYFVAKYAENKRLRIYAESTLFGLIAYVLSSTFISQPYHVVLYVLVALCTAATNVFVGQSEQRFELVERKDYGYAAGVIVGALVLFKTATLILL